MFTFVLLIVVFFILPFSLILCLTAGKSRLQSCLLFIALSHLLASLVIPLLLWLAVGFGKLYIMDTYVELDRKGVIDHAKLQEVRDGYFVGEWKLADDLGGHHFDTVVPIGLGVSVFDFATGIGLLGILWQFRKQNSTALSGTDESGAD